MVCSAEQSRLNGARSKGAITPKGKAIASRNATKHGLLATQPPLLMTEDLSTFEGIVQGLVDHYQPASPAEHHLVQQVAMAMLRQHRLWGVEAAFSNQQLLRAKRDRLLPANFYRQQPSDLERLIEESGVNPKQLTPKQVLEQERRVLVFLMDALTELPTHSHKQAMEELQDILAGATKDLPFQLIPDDYHEAQGYQTYHLILSYQARLELARRHKEITPELLAGEELKGKIATRMTEVDSLLEQLAAIDQELQAATVQSSIVTDTHYRLSDYESRINKSLYAAIDRLEAMRQSRQEAGSMGSFIETA